MNGYDWGLCAASAAGGYLASAAYCEYGLCTRSCTALVPQRICFAVTDSYLRYTPVKVAAGMVGVSCFTLAFATGVLRGRSRVFGETHNGMPTNVYHDGWKNDHVPNFIKKRPYGSASAPTSAALRNHTGGQ